MDKCISEAIDEINEEISKLKAQKTLIESIDIKGKINEDTWHEICETPLRHSGIMANFVANLFPNATNIIVHCNYVYFDLYGFKIQIPTSRQRGINVDLSWYASYKNTEKPTMFISVANKRKLKYYEYCDKGYKWDLKAQAICENDYNKIALFITYLFKKMNYGKKDREIFEKEYRENKEKYEERLERYEIKKEDIHERVKLFKEKVLPEMDAFSTKHGDYNNSCCCGVTVESMLKNEELL